MVTKVAYQGLISRRKRYFNKIVLKLLNLANADSHTVIITMFLSTARTEHSQIVRNLGVCDGSMHF